MGAGYRNGPYETVIESWNGSEWSVQPSPDPGAGYSILNGVACTNPDLCIAVGDYEEGTRTLSMFLSWNGSTWGQTPGPTEGRFYDQPNSVSCISPTNCVSVGVFANGQAGSPGTSQTLVDTWDGSQWQITASPNQGSLNNVLNAVSCIDTHQCFAAGDLINDSGRYIRPLVETGPTP